MPDSHTYESMRRRMELMYEASKRIGASLDVRETAQGIADLLVPAMGDMAFVDLAEEVLTGDEPPRHEQLKTPPRLMRAATSGDLPHGLLGVDEKVPLPAPKSRHRDVLDKEAVFVTRLRPADASVREMDPQALRRLVPPDARSMIMAPLYARGLVMGMAVIMQCREEWSGDDDDLRLLAQITSRGALAIDNARRYEREYRTAVTLQRRLLPPAVTDTSSAETYAAHLPAGRRGAGGGDWFDVIPLSSARVALVTGTVSGHGLQASATMGRLRSAMYTLADLDLEPDELLTHLDDLVRRLNAENDMGGEPVRATCTYLVHDPVRRRCSVASAGHSVPVLAPADGPLTPVPVSPGPALGTDGAPFEVSEWEAAPGSLVAMYTNGLPEALVSADAESSGRTSKGPEPVLGTLRAMPLPRLQLADISDRLLDGVDNSGPPHDVVLLMCRLKTFDEAHNARWSLEARPELVAPIRAAVTKCLTTWGLDDLIVTTSELVLSELVTNSVRYAGGPLEVRLIRMAQSLVCEVSDPSSTQPRLRRARSTDEGGRGLFLVAQMTARWGCRYGHEGKTIWTEQPLTVDL
ncbi:ATP-binding SpoIIE family protein phosphatase [Streptomyces tendae]|uniref:ATP-binding SpoIIE family protein phosphatase n=1 Tax=Streptomyces tendae TaxID=1932 RepID=UPI0033BA46D5